MDEEKMGGAEPAGEEQQGGDPQEMMQDAMQGIQQQIDAINQFAQMLGQAGQQGAAGKFAQGAKILQDGLAELGASPNGGKEQVGGGMSDMMTAGRNAEPA